MLEPRWCSPHINISLLFETLKCHNFVKSCIFPFLFRCGGSPRRHLKHTLSLLFFPDPSQGNNNNKCHNWPRGPFFRETGIVSPPPLCFKPFLPWGPEIGPSLWAEGGEASHYTEWIVITPRNPTLPRIWERRVRSGAQFRGSSCCCMGNSRKFRPKKEGSVCGTREFFLEANRGKISSNFKISFLSPLFFFICLFFTSLFYSLRFPPFILVNKPPFFLFLFPLLLLRRRQPRSVKKSERDLAKKKL